MRDIPLDEFASGDSENGRDEDGDTTVADETDKQGAQTDTEQGAQTAGGATEQPDDDQQPAPPTPTATWTNGGADCPVCGTTVDRRWTDEGSLVCSSCKSW